VKIRELRDFGFFAIKEALLILPIVLSVAVPKTFLGTWGLLYAFTAPSAVVLAFSRRTWSSFTYPKAHFLSAMAVLGGIILFRSQTSFFASWAVLLYAKLKWKTYPHTKEGFIWSLIICLIERNYAAGDKRL